MSRCESAHQWMSGALDHGLASEDARALQAHLQSCPRCRATWAALQEVERILSAPPLVPAPEGFAKRTLARLEACGATAPRQGRKSPFWPVAGAVLTTCSLLLWWIALLGLPALLSWSSPAAWSGLHLLWEALATLARSLMSLLALLVPFCRGMALASGLLVLALSLAAVGGSLWRARLRI
ncbi:MAG: anti-sigma factor family protein [Anaerolineae bacterium]